MGITTTNRTRGCRAHWVALAWLGAAAATGRAAPGDVDMGFGSAGEYLPADSRSQLVALPSGLLLETVVARDGAGIALQTRRLLPDGRPDPAWGVAGEATVDLSRLPFRNEAWAFATWLARPQRDGSNLVQLWLGTDARSSIGGLKAMPLDLVLRLRADGSLDTRYGNQGMTLLQDGNRNWIFDTIPQSDGSALVVEGCNTCDDYPYAERIRRLRPDGAEDTGFAYRGAALESVLSEVFTALRRPDGIVLVVGSGGLLRVDADGRVDTSLGSNGRIDLDEQLTARLREATQRTDVSARIAAATLDREGRIVLALAAIGTPTAGYAIVDAIAIARLDADGGVDSSFGNGSGLGRLSLARAPWAAEPFLNQYMTLGVAEDGGVTVHVMLNTADTTSPRGSPIGLARFDAAGRPRVPIPDAGLQLLGYRAAPNMRAVGPADSVYLSTPRGTVRLRGDAGSSPGLVSFGSVQAREDAGSLRVPLVRAAGSRGAVALEYTTGDVDFPSSSKATAGADYVASTGRVEWADGESGLKFVTIPLIDDALPEPPESFTVRLRAVDGSAILSGSQGTAYILSEETPPPPQSPVSAAPSITPSSPVGGAGGGGGSITPSLLLALLAHALVRRRRVT